MCQVLADLTGTGGDVFQIGDNDGGRIIPLDFVAVNCGRADVLLRLAQLVLSAPVKRRGHAFYPRSGWWTTRAGNWTAMFEFGGVGLAGLGGHAHNDTMSICLLWKDRDVLVDPGSYLYTPDAEARNRLRATSAHNTAMSDNQEQLPLPRRTANDLFSLPGPLKTARVVDALPGRVRANSANWTRSLQVDASGVKITDDFIEPVARRVAWFFHFHPTAQLRALDAALEITLKDGGVLLLRSTTPGLRLEIAKAEYSPFYGTLQDAPSARFRMDEYRPGKVEFAIEER
jgi:hypothetical protein